MNVAVPAFNSFGSARPHVHLSSMMEPVLYFVSSTMEVVNVTIMIYIPVVNMPCNFTAVECQTVAQWVNQRAKRLKQGVCLEEHSYDFKA